MTNEEFAKHMSNEQALFFMLQGKCIPHKKIVKWKLKKLIERDIAKIVEVYSDGDADGYPVWEEHCPSCGYDFDGTTSKFCPDCGQRVLFEEESE